MVDHSIYYLQLSKLQDERSSMQDQLRDYEDRINAMTSHFKNVKQEFLFTQVKYCLKFTLIVSCVVMEHFTLHLHL